MREYTIKRKQQRGDRKWFSNDSQILGLKTKVGGGRGRGGRGGGGGGGGKKVRNVAPR